MKSPLFWLGCFVTSTGLFLLMAAAVNRFTMDRLFSMDERLLTLAIAMAFGAAVCWMVRKKLKARERMQA